MGLPLAITLLREDGDIVPVDVGLSTLVVGNESWTLATVRDDSVRRDVEKASRELRDHYRLAFEHNMAPMIFTDLSDTIIAANNAFCRMIGRKSDEVVDRNSVDFTHPDDVDITEELHHQLVTGELDEVRYVKRYLHKDGRAVIVEVSKSSARNAAGETLYYVISERDLTDERALTEQLSHQALHDPLTGLANRALFEDRIARAHARAGREAGMGAVILIDLDDFKGVNDTLGHLAGDQLLVMLARRLETVTRPEDTLCRFGGDEFLYLAEGLSDSTEAEQIASRLLEEIARPVMVGEMSIEQRASAGIAMWDGASGTPIDSIQNADVAMYEAKKIRHGSHHRVVFTPGLRHQATNRFSLVQDLRRSLHAGELAMHFQPIVALDTLEIVGFEALMRWEHGERGWVPPNAFIPLAEQSDLILELGHFALRETLEIASSWTGSIPWASNCFVSVNLSPHQFQDPELATTIERLLRNVDFDPARLMVEITESATLQNVLEAKSTIRKLNQLGVGIALDDFGTGYTSLSYLMELDPAIIKIDQSFIKQTPEADQSGMLLETIVSLGNKFRVTMLGEGIEMREQMERLRRYGCALGQGHLFSPAVPESELLHLRELIRTQVGGGSSALGHPST